VVFSSSLAAGFSACSGASSCTLLTDESGLAATYVTPLAAGATTITAQLAPASYSPAKQVQTTLAARSLALDLALTPQTAQIAQGASVDIALTARALSNGSPLSGVNVAFALIKGSATLSSPGVVTDANGYATTTLQRSSLSSDVQVSACVTPANLPCVTFYGTAVPASGLQLQPVAGNSQMVLVGQSFQPIVVCYGLINAAQPGARRQCSFSIHTRTRRRNGCKHHRRRYHHYAKSHTNHLVVVTNYRDNGRQWSRRFSADDR